MPEAIFLIKKNPTKPTEQQKKTRITLQSTSYTVLSGREAAPLLHKPFYLKYKTTDLRLLEWEELGSSRETEKLCPGVLFQKYLLYNVNGKTATAKGWSSCVFYK